MDFEKELEKIQLGYEVEQKALIRIGFESALKLLCAKAPNSKYKSASPQYCTCPNNLPEGGCHAYENGKCMSVAVCK